MPDLDTGFVECDSCAAKPGSPVLCNGCLSNRKTMTNLKYEVKMYDNGLKAWYSFYRWFVHGDQEPKIGTGSTIGRCIALVHNLRAKPAVKASLDLPAGLVTCDVCTARPKERSLCRGCTINTQLMFDRKNTQSPIKVEVSLSEEDRKILKSLAQDPRDRFEVSNSGFQATIYNPSTRQFEKISEFCSRHTELLQLCKRALQAYENAKDACGAGSGLEIDSLQRSLEENWEKLHREALDKLNKELVD